MKLSDFDFTLPPDRIATHPASPRDSARLLLVEQGRFTDKTIRDLPSLLKPGDVMVFNDTKVIPARLMGRRGEASVEITLLKEIPPLGKGKLGGDRVHPHGMLRGRKLDQPIPTQPSPFQGEGLRWTAFAKPGKRLKAGDQLKFGPGFDAKVLAKYESGEVELQFPLTGPAFFEALSRHGQMPLPPYIKRKQADPHDVQDYQTVYARKEGAVAAPTAGLHFTPELLAKIDAMGVKRAHVTLHVGAGTFLPVKVENIAEHKIHSEYAEVSAEAAAAINKTKASGGRVIAVGTTSLRTLESATDEQGRVHSFAAETAIFITPGYRFKCVDVLMTNFHLPKSTLFMLVSAFSGLESMKRAYAHAITKNYRFYSYGDACWLEKNPLKSCADGL